VVSWEDPSGVFATPPIHRHAREERDVNTTVLGYPRIGAARELKQAVEKYWSGSGDAADLETTARRLRADTWRDLAGLDAIPGNTFSYYDQMLDHVELVGAVPDRFRVLGLSGLDTYFAMARAATA
jgi:5-methyltetrahydropteroyltriglutamate--homocysteine methyltransferase